MSWLIRRVVPITTMLECLRLLVSSLVDRYSRKALLATFAGGGGAPPMACSGISPVVVISGLSEQRRSREDAGSERVRCLRTTLRRAKTDGAVAASTEPLLWRCWWCCCCCCCWRRCSDSTNASAARCRRSRSIAARSVRSTVVSTTFSRISSRTRLSSIDGELGVRPSRRLCDDAGLLAVRCSSGGGVCRGCWSTDELPTDPRDDREDDRHSIGCDCDGAVDDASSVLCCCCCCCWGMPCVGDAANTATVLLRLYASRFRRSCPWWVDCIICLHT